MNNCKKVQITDPVAVSLDVPFSQKLQVGWVGVQGDKFLFKPCRGSGGFGLYDTEANCLRNTGAPKAIQLRLMLNKEHTL